MSYTINDLRTEYARADSFCQEVHNFRNAAAIPALNELRYAGYHLLNAIDDSYALVSHADLDQAVSHARRASYEAAEAGIMFAIGIVRKFRSDYETIVVSDLVPDYTVRLQKCDEVLRLIERGRQSGRDRDVDHEDRIRIFREIRVFAECLVVARDEANKKVEQRRREARRFAIQTMLTFLAIVVAVSGVIIAYKR